MGCLLWWFWRKLYQHLTEYILTDLNKSMVSCQKGPIRHAYPWQIGPFWQDTIELYIGFSCNRRKLNKSYRYHWNCHAKWWLSAIIYHDSSWLLIWPTLVHYITDINTLGQRWNGWHFADNIFKCIFLNEWFKKNFTVLKHRIGKMSGLVHVMLGAD